MPDCSARYPPTPADFGQRPSADGVLLRRNRTIRPPPPQSVRDFLSGASMLSVVGDIPRCTVVIEACTSAFYWARQFEALGHHVTIISPQYVKPFVRRQKNDGNDAEAIVTAARQPHIPRVTKKTIEQQDIQAMHRARQRMVNHRTAVVSQIRGLLLDRGFAFAESITRARRLIPALLSDMTNELTTMAREAIAELWDLMCDLDRRVAIIDQK